MLLAAFGIFGCGAADSGASGNGRSESPHIEVRISGMTSGRTSLIGTNGDQRFTVDTASIDAKGKVVFQRAEPYPSGFYFLLLPDQSYIQLLIDQDQTFSMETTTNDLIKDMEVVGSLDNELFYKSLKFEMNINPPLQEIAQQLKLLRPGSQTYQEVKERQRQLIDQRTQFLEDLFNEYPNTFFTSFKIAGQNPEAVEVFKTDGSLDTARQVYLYRNRFWEDVDFNDERLLRTPVIINKLQRYMTELTAQTPDSINQSAAFLIDQVLDKPAYFKFFANWIAMHYEPTKTPLMDSEAIYVFMVQNYFTRERAFWADSMQVYALQQRAGEMASSLIGRKGPDVTAKDPSGKLRSISEIKAPYLIVYLYNPTCDHCIEETPRLVSFYREWKNKGVEVYAIALDTNEQEWKNFIARNNMNWINVFDPTNRAFYGKYFVDNTPEIYVLDPQRIIIGKNLKVFQIPEVIQRDRMKG